MKNHILTNRVKILDFNPVDRGEFPLAHTRDLKETNSMEEGKGYFLSEYPSSMFSCSSSARLIRGDIGFSEWIPGQSQSEITAIICLTTPFNRKIVQYA